MRTQQNKEKWWIKFDQWVSQLSLLGIMGNNYLNCMNLTEVDDGVWWNIVHNTSTGNTWLGFTEKKNNKY
jgi:hypothetical protein